MIAIVNLHNVVFITAVIRRWRDFFVVVWKELLHLKDVLLLDRLELWVYKLHFYGKYKSWTFVFAFREETDRPTAVQNYPSADNKAHAHTFLIQIIVLRQFAKSFEQLILISGGDPFTWVSDRDSKQLTLVVVSCCDFYFPIGRKFERILCQVDQNLLQAYLVSKKSVR